MNNPRPDQIAVRALLVAALAVALPNQPALITIPAAFVLLTLPGYWWSRVILPRLEPRSVERVLASLLLSIVIVISSAMVMYSIAVRLTHVTWSIALTVIAVAGWWTTRRLGARSPVNDQSPETDGQPRDPRRRRTPTVRDAVLIGLAAIVLGGTIVLARTPLPPPSGVQGYSQLWLLPKPSGFELGVASFELHPTHFRVEFIADGAVVGRWDDVFLVPGQRFTEVVTSAGSFLEARLYLKDGSSPDPYRSVHIGVPPETSAPQQ